ncbi:MAG: methanogenesis marker 5 protein [Methanosarcinales archaeon]
MVKVLVYPANSLILADLVERFGHEPLSVQQEIREKISAPGLDSPPLNITPDDPKIGLRYAAVEVPSGVRGRMALLGPLIEEAEAAVVVHDPDPTFGCMGCARTNELVNFLIRARKIPLLELKYPSTEDDARDFVVRVAEFLKSLENGK